MKKVPAVFAPYTKFNHSIKSLACQIATQKYMDRMHFSEVKELSSHCCIGEDSDSRAYLDNFLYRLAAGRGVTKVGNLHLLKNTWDTPACLHFSHIFWRLVNQDISLEQAAVHPSIRGSLLRNPRAFAPGNSDIYPLLKRCYRQQREMLYRAHDLDSLITLLVLVRLQEFYGHARPNEAEKFAYCAYLYIFGVRYRASKRSELGYFINQLLNDTRPHRKYECPAIFEQDFQFVENIHKKTKSLSSKEAEHTISLQIKTHVFSRTNHPCFTAATPTYH